MPEIEGRLDRIEQAVLGLTGVTGDLARTSHALVQGLASDRGAFRETLRGLDGFVATAGIALARLERQLERLERQVGRLAEITETGFARLQLALEENNRLIVENNRLIAENNAVIRRLLEILTRGRGNGEGLPA